MFIGLKTCESRLSIPEFSGSHFIIYLYHFHFVEYIERKTSMILSSCLTMH